MMFEEDGFGFGLCPSFSSYSINGFAEAAARVTADSDLCSVSGNDHALVFESIDDEFQEGDDFEFVSIPANEPAFPTFFYHGVVENRLHGDFRDPDNEDVLAVRNSLEKLMLCDRDPPSTSSSEADEMERIPPGTYCMWTPKTAEVAEGGCKKSKSTGSSSSPSRRWKLRDLLRRSSSDGKSSVAFINPTKNEANGEKMDGEDKSGMKPKGKGAPGEKSSPGSAHEAFYLNNRRLKEQVKRKSYLPYRIWLGFGSISTSPSTATATATASHCSKFCKVSAFLEQIMEMGDHRS